MDEGGKLPKEVLRDLTCNGSRDHQVGYCPRSLLLCSVFSILASRNQCGLTDVKWLRDPEFCIWQVWSRILSKSSYPMTSSMWMWPRWCDRICEACLLLHCIWWSLSIIPGSQWLCISLSFLVTFRLDCTELLLPNLLSTITHRNWSLARIVEYVSHIRSPVVEWSHFYPTMVSIYRM